MRFLSVTHCHSTFSDGDNSMEEMVLAAIGKGFVSIGFSEHGWASYDFDCCIKQENIPAYFAEAARLRERYRDQIEIYAGFESDYFFPAPKEEQDFTVGSVHYIRDTATDSYYNVDYTHDMLEAARDKVAGGDVRALIALYFDQVGDMAETYQPDILGHLDLITKLNGESRYFDENRDWYRRIVSDTCDRVAATGCIVELNTGGMFRGYRQQPYPSPWLLERLQVLGVPVTINSDSHAVESINFWFDEAVALLRRTGFRSVKQLRGGSFIDVEL